MPSTLNTVVGDPAADSYITQDDASTYHAARGNDAWLDGDETAWDTALRRATVWLDGRYRGYWKGQLTHMGPSPAAQALAWPRMWVIDDEGRHIDPNSIPTLIQWAQAEAALRELANPGSLSPDQDRETTSEHVGNISVTYLPGSEDRLELSVVNDLIDGLLIGDGSSTTHFIQRA
jgi:hypothetical protein